MNIYKLILVLSLFGVSGLETKVSSPKLKTASVNKKAQIALQKAPKHHASSKKTIEHWWCHPHTLKGVAYFIAFHTTFILCAELIGTGYDWEHRYCSCHKKHDQKAYKAKQRSLKVANS